MARAGKYGPHGRGSKQKQIGQGRGSHPAEPTKPFLSPSQRVTKEAFFGTSMKEDVDTSREGALFFCGLREGEGRGWSGGSGKRGIAKGLHGRIKVLGDSWTSWVFSDYAKNLQSLILRCVVATVEFW